MGGFIDFLKLDVPQLDAKCNDVDVSVLDKLKCSICEIITMYSQVAIFFRTLHRTFVQGPQIIPAPEGS